MSLDVATDQPAGELLQRVEKVIDIIRPAIQADDGDIVLHGVDEATGELARNMALARSLQFTGTPSWVAGDEIIQGLVPVERLAEASAG